MDTSSFPEEADGASSSDVAHFVSLTSCPVDQATFFLEATNGNLDQAVEMYYGVSPALILEASQMMLSYSRHAC